MFAYGKDNDGSREEKNILQQLQMKYMQALKANPLLTKSLTSGIVGASGSLAAQLINIRKGNAAKVNYAELIRYGTFGFAVTSPIMHMFYKWLDKNIPPKSREAMIKRLLIERLVLTPGVVVCFHALMAGMEKRNIGAMKDRIKLAFWATLLMNWKFWTVLQIININYIPRDLKVVFGNACGFAWTILLAANTKGKNT